MQMSEERGTNQRHIEMVWAKTLLWLSLGDKYVEICFIIVLKLHIPTFISPPLFFFGLDMCYILLTYTNKSFF